MSGELQNQNTRWDESADIVVIGAGMVGAAIAYGLGGRAIASGLAMTD